MDSHELGFNCVTPIYLYIYQDLSIYILIYLSDISTHNLCCTG